MTTIDLHERLLRRCVRQVRPSRWTQPLHMLLLGEVDRLLHRDAATRRAQGSRDFLPHGVDLCWVDPETGRTVEIVSRSRSGMPCRVTTMHLLHALCERPYVPDAVLEMYEAHTEHGPDAHDGYGALRASLLYCHNESLSYGAVRYLIYHVAQRVEMMHWCRGKMSERELLAIGHDDITRMIDRACEWWPLEHSWPRAADT